MPNVYKGLHSSFVALAWSWSGRSFPQGEPAGVLVPWTGAECDQAPCSPFTNYSELRSTRPNLVSVLATRCLYGGYMTERSTWHKGWPNVKLTRDASMGGTSDLRAKRTSENLNTLGFGVLLHRSYLRCNGQGSWFHSLHKEYFFCLTDFIILQNKCTLYKC